jgi:hypothetical protein
MKIEVDSSLPCNGFLKKDTYNLKNPIFSEIHATVDQERQIILVSEKLYSLIGSQVKQAIKNAIMSHTQNK